MTFTEAAVAVLRLVGKPLHYKEITDVAIERSLLSHVGKSPEVTMGARLAAQVKKTDKENPIKRIKPGVFALAEWDDVAIEEGLADRTPALEKLAQLDPSGDTSTALGVGDAAADIASVDALRGLAPMAAHREIDDRSSPLDEEEQHRAELSQAASELFESEDDDDQPIFGGPLPTVEVEGDRIDRSEGKRRRRRRRGRGRRDEELATDDVSDDMPTYTVSDAEPEEVLIVEELTSELEGSDEPALSLASAIEGALSRYDRSKGPVAAQNVADSLRRKFKTDASLSGGAVIAAAAADNLASERRHIPPRFILSGNRIALTTWSQDKKVQERAKAVVRAVEQLEESVHKALAEELKRLGQRATGELILVLLERMGVSDMQLIRRPGSHGAELHLAGRFSIGDAIRTKVAIVIRRDGKDIGRERVTELRGALHHYEGATLGWIFSTGQVLSGAREEAHAPGASPVALTGRPELAQACVQHGVGIRTQRVEFPVLDTELLDQLQGR